MTAIRFLSTVKVVPDKVFPDTDGAGLRSAGLIKTAVPSPETKALSLDFEIPPLLQAVKVRADASAAMMAIVFFILFLRKQMLGWLGICNAFNRTIII